MQTTTLWLPKEIDTLKKEWLKGTKVSSIADAIGRSGGAIIGMARRLALGEHPWKTKQKLNKAITKRGRWYKGRPSLRAIGLRKPFNGVKLNYEECLQPAVSLLDLKEGQCRTLIYTNKSIMFCCGLPVHKRDCCEAHYNRFYNTLPLQPFRN